MSAVRTTSSSENLSARARSVVVSRAVTSVAPRRTRLATGVVVRNGPIDWATMA